VFIPHGFHPLTLQPVSGTTMFDESILQIVSNSHQTQTLAHPDVHSAQ